MMASNTNSHTGNSPILDVSYRDTIGATEMLSMNSSHMCTRDGTVDLNVCNVAQDSMLRND
jgi:hypothetical protein